MADTIKPARSLKSAMPTGAGQDYVYGCAFTDDYLLRNPASLPRFATLARKALLHYAGDRYNPNTDGLRVEPFIREMIKEFISYKVLYRTKSYDWEWIDQSFRKAIGRCLNIDLTYCQARIDKGFQGGSKADQTISWSAAH